MSDEIIRCMLLPLAEDYLLLPHVTVAEVIAYVEPDESSDENKVIGAINWRGVSVPIISFEKVCDLAVKENSIRDRIAILYHPNGDEDKPYLGVKLIDIPKSFRAEVNGLVDEKVTIKQSDYIYNQLSNEGRRLFIPNLEYMFEQLI